MNRILLCCGWLIALTPGWTAAQAPVVVSRVTGAVEVSRGAGIVFEPAFPGAALLPGDHVRTRGGRVELTFPDGSRLRLRHHSSVTITRVEAARAAGAWRMSTRLLSGMIRCIVRPLPGEASFRITSDRAITAVKGTDFVFDGERVVVFDEGDPESHAVQLSAREADGDVMVTEGTAAGIGKDGRPGLPIPSTGGEADRLRSEFEFPVAVSAPVPAGPVAGVHQDLLPATGVTGVMVATGAERPAVLGGAAGLLSGGSGLAGSVSGADGGGWPPVPGGLALPDLPRLP